MAANGKDYGFFWNSDNGDRTYDADSYNEYFSRFFTTGVFEGDLQVTSTGNMGISVAKGACNIEQLDTEMRKVRIFETPTAFTVPASNGTYPRIDTVVIERNDTDRNIYLKYVTGAYSGEAPSATAPTRTSTVYQLVLAEIYVGAGVTEITQANITDKRTDTDVCGYVTQGVQTMSFEQFSAQFDSYYAQFKSGNESDFDTWFQEMKDQLSEDAAGNLQNEITELDSKLSNASNINYSNTSSGMSATDVQSAIDELDSAQDGLADQLTANGNAIYLDYQDGRYGYNTSASRGADTFSPFKSKITIPTITTLARTNSDVYFAGTSTVTINVKNYSYFKVGSINITNATSSQYYQYKFNTSSAATLKANTTYSIPSNATTLSFNTRIADGSASTDHVIRYNNIEIW